MTSKKLYELVPKKHGIGGLTAIKPAFKKQDRRASSYEGYAVVFFPRVKGIMRRASVNFFGVSETLSQTPQAAKVKFMDSFALGQTWAQYARAGHRVRKIRIVDLGDA